MVCVSRFRLGRGSLTHFWIIFFLIGKDLLFSIAKTCYRTGSAPHAPSETSRHRPPTALKLGNEDSTLSEPCTVKLGHDSCPVRRGLVAAVKCRVRTTRFFDVQAGCGTEREKPGPCVGLHHKEETLLCFLFSDPIIVGLKYILSILPE